MIFKKWKYKRKFPKINKNTIILQKQVQKIQEYKNN